MTRFVSRGCVTGISWITVVVLLAANITATVAADSVNSNIKKDENIVFFRADALPARR